MNKTRVSRQKVALIAGPTASGKSALAVRLGGMTPSVVINADSAQVYADLRILSARPDAAEMAGVEHRLYGHIDAADPCSAARWAADARAEIACAGEAGKLPILVGGTGLYLRTLLEGIAPVPPIDPEIRAEVRALAVADAHAALAVEDPAAAARLSPADTTRVARALEVVRATGRTLADWQSRRTGGIASEIDLAPLVLLPPRPWLFERIAHRFARMIEDGAIEEVRALRDRDLDPALPAMRAIGVPEILAHLDGRMTIDALIERGTIATRQYAKRQYTWFSRQPPSDWPVFSEALNDSNTSNLVIKIHDNELTE